MKFHLLRKGKFQPTLMLASYQSKKVTKLQSFVKQKIEKFDKPMKLVKCTSVKRFRIGNLLFGQLKTIPPQSSNLNIFLTKLVDYWYTKKYPLSGYILGVLTYETSWNRHWGAYELLN